jgi:hypothetical protein
MRLRFIALGCTLTGALGFLALPPAAAQAGRGLKPQISISAPATDNPYGTRVELTVTLRPAFADRRVKLYASPYGGTQQQLVLAGEVNARGKWYPTYALTRKTTFTVVSVGNMHDDPISAHVTVDAYARVANRISGYAKTTRISGLSYDVYHGSGTLTLYSTVAPDSRGECLEPETEQYDAGTGWDADTKYGCDTLNSKSQDTAPFTLSLAAGDRYRIRGDYLPGAKDVANLGEQGPWLCFTVTK